MKALGKFVVVELVKQEDTITKAGIVVMASNESFTTNSGDKVGSSYKYIVKEIGDKVTIDLEKEDEVVVNPWALQLFETDGLTFGVVPEEEIKVVK